MATQLHPPATLFPGRKASADATSSKPLAHDTWVQTHPIDLLCAREGWQRSELKETRLLKLSIVGSIRAPYIRLTSLRATSLFCTSPPSQDQFGFDVYERGL